MVSKPVVATAVATDSEHITYIPFVRDSQDFVNASLIVRTSANDTGYKFLCDWQYSSYGYDTTATGWNARDVFHIFAQLDNQVFGRNEYKITDENLLTQAEKNYMTSLGLSFDSARVVYQIQPSQNSGGRNSFLMPVTICNDIYTCIKQPLAAFKNNTGVTQINPGNCASGTWLISTICTEVLVEIPSGNTGGTGGTGGTGSGSGGSGGGGGSTPPNCNGNTFNGNQLLNDTCQTGWVPILWEPYVCNYQMTQQEIDIFLRIDNDDDEVDNQHGNQNFDCQGTRRLGNINFNGTKEHWLIQLDYVSKYASAEREYQIPNSGPSGGRGYADIVNLFNGNIFEIKPDNIIAGQAGLVEVLNYVTTANTHCISSLPPGVMWNLGNYYPTVYLPTINPSRFLKARLMANGVIGYSYETHNSNPSPVPIAIPASILDKFRELVERLKQNLANADRIIAEFLRQHPQVLTFIKTVAVGAGVAIIVGTLAEDIFTMGAGIADDWASFQLAYRIIRFALAL